MGAGVGTKPDMLETSDAPSPQASATMSSAAHKGSKMQRTEFTRISPARISIAFSKVWRIASKSINSCQSLASSIPRSTHQRCLLMNLPLRHSALFHWNTDVHLPPQLEHSLSASKASPGFEAASTIGPTNASQTPPLECTQQPFHCKQFTMFLAGVSHMLRGRGTAEDGSTKRSHSSSVRRPPRLNSSYSESICPVPLPALPGRNAAEADGGASGTPSESRSSKPERFLTSIPIGGSNRV
mmetsp:Transcript_15770/g.36250  ORF Transcript_15770/g.36250 Transcript_15770/m.36250 type:complete len:241 (-) Transcript_15770:21-743(-)